MALRAHKIRQTEEKEAAGERWQEFGLVFTTTIGTPIRASNFIRRDFKPLLTKATLPVIRPHDLRHSYATLLLEGGVPLKVVSELLSHSQISITADIYQHVRQSMHEDAVAVLTKAIGTQIGPNGAGDDEGTGG